MSGSGTWLFGDFALDLRRRALSRGGIEVFLRPKSFEVLCQLVQNHGTLISRQQLLDLVWGRTVVTEDSVTQCVLDVRRAIGDEHQQFVRTVPRRGYVFVAPVVAAEADAASAAKSPVPVAIAVLPFVDMSPGHDQRYLADGIAEEILDRLARSKNLRVIARTSSFALRSPALDVPTIAAKLDVDYVLEGSVRRSGHRVRVTAQLIDAECNSHVWSSTHDRSFTDLFALQDDIATTVASGLQAVLAQPARPAEAESVASCNRRRRTVTPPATQVRLDTRASAAAQTPTARSTELRTHR